MLKHLASGGMADVLLGRSEGIAGFERHVAVKRIRPDLARDQRFVRMFVDEARVAATLHHQHIVQVHDIGEADGEYFLTMEYVHGEDVCKILANAARQRTHVPVAYAVAIVSAAAAGLHHAHERRGADNQPLHIVHRDVSPSNILIGYDGSIKVVDFGIASASMREQTRSGTLRGKLSYMAPEQCRDLPVDRRADVYALGVVLYELVTTTRMLKGKSDYRMMERIIQGKIAPPHTRRPDLPAELSNIIMRAIATDPDQRYATADELRIALDRFATRTALTVSTSAIAAYMRQQFGQRPEPWLELDDRVGGAIEDVPTAPPPPRDESERNDGWAESPHRGADRGVTPSSIRRQSESRMGWEHLLRVPSRRTPIQKLWIGSASALVAGLVLWLITPPARTPSAPTPAAAAVSPSTPPPHAVSAAALDAHPIQNAIHRDGSDRPFAVNDKPTPGCTAFRFADSPE